MCSKWLVITSLFLWLFNTHFCPSNRMHNKMTRFPSDPFYPTLTYVPIRQINTIRIQSNLTIARSGVFCHSPALYPGIYILPHARSKNMEGYRELTESWQVIRKNKISSFFQKWMNFENLLTQNCKIWFLNMHMQPPTHWNNWVKTWKEINI